MTQVQLQTIALDELDANTGQIPGLPANPRDWTDRELRNLARSMRETPLLTQARGAVVIRHNGRYVILGGNMRRAAAEHLGWTEMPCIVIPEATPAKELKAIVLKDNSTFGKFRVDMLKADWGEFEFQDMGISLPEAPKGTKEAQEDNYDPSKILNSKKEPKTKRGDVIRLGEHILICGDSTDAQVLDRLMFIGGDIADLYITDPPYNVDYVGKTDEHLKIENDKMSDTRFRDFLTDAFTVALQAVKPGGAAYVWMASTEIDAAIESFEKAGWLYKQLLIWVKNTIVINRQDYQWQHEPCIYGWRPGEGHYFTDSRRESTVAEIGGKPIEAMSINECRRTLKAILEDNGVATSVLHFPKPLRSAEHPTMKPVELIGHHIKNSSRKGDIVLDTFGGSGTTLVACEQLDRRCRMVELDPVYCDVIVDRWEKLTGKKAQRPTA